MSPEKKKIITIIVKSIKPPLHTVSKIIPDGDINLFVKQYGRGEIFVLRLIFYTQAIKRAVKTIYSYICF